MEKKFNQFHLDDLKFNSDSCSSSLSHNSDNDCISNKQSKCPKLTENHNIETDNNVIKEDNNSSFYCVEITHNELTKNLETKSSLENQKCRINILTAKESEEYFKEKIKKETTEKFFKEAKKNKFKTIPIGRKFNSKTKKFELIDKEFDEAINKEFNDYKYLFPNDRIITHVNEKEIPKIAEVKNIKERAKTLGIKLDVPSEHQESSKGKRDNSKKEKKENKRKEKKEDYSRRSASTNITDDFVEYEKNNNYGIKKRYYINIKKMRKTIIKQIYMKNNEEKYNIKLIYKESERFQRHIESNNYLFKYIPKENKKQFYKTGIFIFRNLLNYLLTGAKRNNNDISILEYDIWKRDNFEKEVENYQTYENKNKYKNENIGVKRTRGNGTKVPQSN